MAARSMTLATPLFQTAAGIARTSRTPEGKGFLLVSCDHTSVSTRVEIRSMPGASTKPVMKVLPLPSSESSTAVRSGSVGAFETGGAAVLTWGTDEAAPAPEGEGETGIAGG